MTVFNHINDVQKVFENLDIDWVKITPEEKIVNLKMAIENINILLSICHEESNILTNYNS
jgi:hypothetical protein